MICEYTAKCRPSGCRCLPCFASSPLGFRSRCRYATQTSPSCLCSSSARPPSALGRSCSNRRQPRPVSDGGADRILRSTCARASPPARATIVAVHALCVNPKKAMQECGFREEALALVGTGSWVGTGWVGAGSWVGNASWVGGGRCAPADHVLVVKVLRVELVVLGVVEAPVRRECHTRHALRARSHHHDRAHRGRY